MRQSAADVMARDRLLVCLDLQRQSAPEPAPDGCIVNCRRVLGHARRVGWGVAHVYMKTGRRGGRPIEGLEPLTSEPLIYRPGISAFSSPAFRRLVTGSDYELVIIGSSMSSSCLATALVAYDNDFAVTVVEDAVSATPLETATREALEMVSRQIAEPFVRLTSTADLLGQSRLLRVV